MAAIRPETVSRWRGTAGRMEVWYATCSEADGSGWWFHYERVAPAKAQPRLDDTAVGAPEAYVHGWVAAFPVAGQPILERFGPIADTTRGEGWLLSAAGASVHDAHMTGRAGRLAWDIAIGSEQPALYTFPKWAWDRELLPGAQVVDTPGASFTGTVSVDGVERTLTATGARAHIFSRGNAREWTWLHAELGGGDTLEVVSAVSHLPLPSRLRPLPVVRLRLQGRDLPRDPLLWGLGGHGTVSLPGWRVQAPLGGRRRLSVHVEMAPENCVQIEYPNPDGSHVYCTNSERASAAVRIEAKVGGRWTTDAEWVLESTAHAEVGRPRPWSAVAHSEFDWKALAAGS